MSQKRIKVEIKGGKSKVTAEGYTGTSCMDATKAIEEALGTVEEDTKLDAYYEEGEDNELNVDSE